MSTKRVVGSSAALTALLLSSTAPAAQAIEVDTAAPELVSFEIDQDLIDAREGGTVTATAHITDETCLDVTELKFTLENAVGNQVGDVEQGVPADAEVNCQDDVYTVDFTIPANALGTQPFGEWDVVMQPLTDDLGNKAESGDERSFAYAASPDAVAELQVASATSTAVSASWTAPDTNGFPITEYVAEILDDTGTIVATETVTETSAVLAVDLTAGEAYTLAVTAFNEVGGTQTAEADFTAEATPATPEAVVFVDMDGTANDTYTIPEIEGIEYLVDGEVVPTGTYSAADTVTVTARAAVDYVLTEDADTTWTTEFANTIAVTPEAPAFVDEDGTAEDTYTIPDTANVHYLVDGEVVEAGTYEATGTVTVTAQAAPGYTFPAETTDTWEQTFDATATVTPELPVFVDELGTEDDTYTIPDVEGVEYLLDGEVVEAGTYEATGTVTITVRATEGYAFPEGTEVQWTNEFSTAEANPFIDITPEDNFYEEILWMAETGISGGWATPEGKVYRAHDDVDRDVMAAFLYRLAGSPDFTAPETSPFLDVEPDDTFYKEMAWMAEQDISGGWDVGDGKEYRPHTPVDRDVMAAFLYRMADSPAFTAPAESPFLDVEPGDTFYKEMAWMAEADISGGWDVGDGKEYRPHTAVDRDVMAAFLYRLSSVL